MIKSILILFSSIVLQTSVTLAKDCSDVAMKEAKEYSKKYIQEAFEIKVTYEGELSNLVSSDSKYNDEHLYLKSVKEILNLLPKNLHLYESTYFIPGGFSYISEFVAFIFHDHNCKLQSIIQLGSDYSQDQAG